MSYQDTSRKQPSPLAMPVRLGVAAVAACFLSAPVLSNPLNPTVVNGVATFNQAGNVLTVTNSNGAIINWQKFSIQAGETTHFAQTSASSSVLNRVLSDPTAIYGTLSSNGRVWLVNPAGIMVGPGGRVDVAAFVASTLNISNADFLAGRNVFINDGSAGNVINQGEIRTPAGGSVYLIGSNVSNEGIITTPKGETILAAGATVSLIDSATPGVKVDITGSEGNATNLGTITAEAGRIGIAGVIVRNSGQVNASSVVEEGGRIFLRARRDTYVDGNGKITATGTRGGQVEVLGERVAVTDQSSIDASGTGEANAGGGKILVGGDYQGKNPDTKNANVSYFGPDATLKADAGKVGDGGTVIVWADDTTRAYGSISARGGALGGNGGFIETSGHSLDVSGLRVRADAPNGSAGQWLLDPINVTIAATADAGGALSGGMWTPSATGSTITNTTIQNALAGGTSVTITTTGALAEQGNITVDAPIGPTGATSALLTLQADNDINVNAAIGTVGARFNHDLSLNAGNRIGINSPIYLSNTMFSATAPAIDINAVMDVGTGTVRLSSTGAVTQSTTLPAAITAGVLELLGAGGTHTLTHAGNQVGVVKMNTGSVVLTNNGTTTVDGFPAIGAGQESIVTAATPVVGELLGSSIAVNGDVMVVGAPGAHTSGQGAAYVYRWNGTSWVFEARLTVVGAINFGTSVAVEGNNIVVGAPDTTDGEYRSGAAYPFVWNGSSWVAGTKLAFADKVFESTFGGAVAIDSGRLVVGGGGRTSEGGFWTGKIWFYDLVSGAWVERGHAIQSDPQSNDYFGFNLDISGNRMIVGAPQGPSYGTAGKAYIFEFNPATRLWTQTQKLTQTAGVVADYFGSNVSISGDLAIVGAARAAPGGKVNAGSLYAFRYNGTNWAAEQIISPTDLAAGDLFGTGARVRDGVIVAASYRADLPGAVDAGAGYVFKYNGTQWLQDAKITATTPVASDQFGFSAVLADQRMFFGAYGADPGGTVNAGAAYVYDPVVSGSTLTGGLTITSAGALTQAVPVNAGGAVSYKSASNIAINAALNASGYLGLGAANTLNINQSVEANNIELSAASINVNGPVRAYKNAALVSTNIINLYGSVQADGTSATPSTISGIPYSGIAVIANDVYGSGSSAYLKASSATGDISGLIAGNVTLDNGAYFQAGNDVDLTFTGPASTISLSSGGYVLANSPSTIYLTFTTRTTGGVMIDGTAMTTSLPDGSGFFVVSHLTPATTSVGGGLAIDYSNAAAADVIVVDPCASSPDLCKLPIPIDNPVIDIVEADPCATSPDSAECKAQKPDDEGEEQDKFGNEETDGNKKSGQKKVAQCM